MKSIALNRPSQYAGDLIPTTSTSSWSGAEEKSTRCKSVDSFNFLMGIINNDRYAVRDQGKSRVSFVQLNDRASWKADFYNDDYITDEDNRK